MRAGAGGGHDGRMITSPVSTRPAPVVTVDGLTKRYGDAAAVDSLSFHVPAGEVVGLLGPNGAGKTTAMKMMVGLVTPTSGRATVLSAEIGGPEYAPALRRVGALIEAPALYERLSARRNLELQARTLGLGRHSSDVDELLSLVELTDRADDAARTYSLGMKQRLGIAVAMVARPELVILDEPANGLDPAGIVEIRRLLRRLPDMGTTVLVSSHQLAEVQQACDRLIILAAGRLVATGATSDILAGDGTSEWDVRVAPAEIAAAGTVCQEHGLTVATRTLDTLRIVPPPDWTGREINRMLGQAGIYPCELVRRTATLEETFLHMTGATR